MRKKEVKEDIKSYMQAAAQNQCDLKTLDILSPVAHTSSCEEWSHDRVLRNVNMYTREKAFSLTLENGPFRTTYTENGTNALITNAGGYAAAYNTQHLKPRFEVDVADRIHDACWLHNEHYFALAQETALFIYNSSGAEQHAVRSIVNPRILAFLPYHFLLATAANTGKLKYLDTSTGEIVADVFVHDKKPTSMRANPSNGVVYLGAASGAVSLWSPAQKEYLMKISCHGSAVTNMEIDRAGNRLVTTGLDNSIKIFDIRQTHSASKTIKLKAPVQTTALSQKNLLAMGCGNKTVILKDFEDVHMKHTVCGAINSLEFCNHEDILSIGHKTGVSYIVVPESGDPVYDSSESSPFLTAKQRQSLEVKRLLEKVPYDLIAMDSILASVAPRAKRQEPGARYFEAGERPRNALSRFKRSD